jgi:hypothetical protein
MLANYNFNPTLLAQGTLVSATIFTVLWFLDALTHAKLVHVNITDKELQTHRSIMLTSILMELSLVLMYWFKLEALPLFIAFFITRTAHEFIDELHYHANRCSSYESYLHLGMWVSVLTKTFFMFIWGFFYQYQGILELNISYIIWGGALVMAMSAISFIEWKR